MDNLFSQYVYLSRYSRFLHDQNRRETWPETVKRYFDFMEVHLKTVADYTLEKELRLELETAVLRMEVMPSMRALMTAGPALEKNNIAGYNCAYLPIDNPKAFAETMMILMNGTGVGFSVERQYINQLPVIPDELFPTDTTIIVHDSKIGWTKALNELVSLLYTGLIPKWDTSRVRPAGSLLKTFGGRASGPEPLEKLFRFIVDVFKNNKGQRLTSIDVHDIECMIGDCVVVGGVRRSALISLSNLSDERMRNAKTGQWWTLTPWRSNANNSAVYTDKIPEMGMFMSEWKSLYDSKAGERGIFSRYASRNIIQRANDFRKTLNIDDMRYRDIDWEWGTNPCSEIILRPNQFCNLTEVVIRSDDTIESLSKKVRIAAILGTFQSTLTDFKFLSKKWRSNTEDERLLGVSLTGIMDNVLTSGCEGIICLRDVLLHLKTQVILTNKDFAAKLGIPQSTAVTAVKPSGTVSALNGTSSGIHARHAPFYLRSVRSDKKDPISQLLIDQGFYVENDKMNPSHVYVFYFPQKSPETSVMRRDMDAIKQLEIWKTYQLYWTEHKPSVTVSVKDNEWMKVGSWVYENFEWMSGVSFLPYSDHSYEQAPFQEVDEETFKKWSEKTPEKIDWGRLTEYEKTDTTTGSQEFACVAGCEI